MIGLKSKKKAERDNLLVFGQQCFSLVGFLVISDKNPSLTTYFLDSLQLS